MTYKVADKLGIERKNWKTAFLTSIYNETATVHGRIDRSENIASGRAANHRVHGRIDRSESLVFCCWRHRLVHGRIDRSEMSHGWPRSEQPVHGRIDRSEIGAEG